MSASNWITVLRCPKCKGELSPATVGDVSGLACAADELLFPIRDGMPIMLIEQAISTRNNAS